MNIAIIEDETPALNRIKKLIAEVVPIAQIIFTADSIASAIKQFQLFPNIDLAMLDIELADGQSFEIFKQVNITCPVIFTTAYDEFALKAFKLNSIDYLLKPIDKDELKKSFEKFQALKGQQSNYQAQLQYLVETFYTKPTQIKSRFLIKNGNKLISISVNDIAYFHALDKQVYVLMNDSKKYIVDYSLDELTQLLPAAMFFQLNRQFIANIDCIKSIHSYFNGKLKVDLLPATNDEVIVSREKASEFKKWLNH
jgi:two-component system LytT family response regulator